MGYSGCEEVGGHDGVMGVDGYVRVKRTSNERETEDGGAEGSVK